MQLILATRNRGKVEELKALLEGLPVKLTSLADHPEVPKTVEDGDTFAANAEAKEFLKRIACVNLCSLSCFAIANGLLLRF